MERSRGGWGSRWREAAGREGLRGSSGWKGGEKWAKNNSGEVCGKGGEWGTRVGREARGGWGDSKDGRTLRGGEGGGWEERRGGGG